MVEIRRKIIIAIDTGTKTGFAVKDLATQKFIEVKTLKRWRMYERILELGEQYEIYVVFEDARLRTWFGKKEAVVYKKIMSHQRVTNEEINFWKGMLMGSGAIRTSCTALEEFLIDNKIPYVAIKPKRGATKLNPDYVKRITKWEGRSSEHSRDAMMLALPYSRVNLKLHFFKNQKKIMPWQKSNQLRKKKNQNLLN